MRLTGTSFWVALAASNDRYHSDAVALWTNQREPLVVTNHVSQRDVDVPAPSGRRAVARAALAVSRSARVLTVHVEPDNEQEAWNWLERHDERPYSFVDATSCVVMRSRRIRQALAFDPEFTAAGFQEVRP